MTTRKKIFVVDDNLTILNICKDILKPYYETYTATSAAKLFDLLGRVIPDLILLDVAMPDIDGYETARFLKGNAKYRKIPIIFVTTKDDEISELEGLNIGAVDYITKPISAPLLLKRMETYLSLQELNSSLEAAVAKLETVVSSYPGVIWSVDLDGTINLFNGLYLENIGVTPDFLEGKNINMTRQKNRYLDLIENVQKTFAEGPQDWFSEIDGKTFRVRTIPIRDENGGVTGLVGNIDDMTEMLKLQKELETALTNAENAVEALKAAQATTSAMFEANPQMNILFDREFKVIDCNPAAINFMEFDTKEEFFAGFISRITGNIPPFQPDGNPSIPLAERLMTVAKEGCVKFETEIIKNGVKKILDVEFKRIPYENSFAIVGYIFDMTDIHEREMELKYAHEQNELQLAKLNVVISATKIGIYDVTIVNNEPNNPGNVFSWSDEYRHMLGYKDKSDFPDTFESWYNRLHPDDKEMALETITKHLTDKTGKTPYDTEYRVLKKNGEYSYFHASGETIRDKDGNAIRAVGSLIDITETKNILLDSERQRIAADAASKAKSLFLSSMSHEIRTPMNAIIGMAAIAEETDSMERKDYAVSKIKDASDHLLGVINDILDVSKIEAGKFELSPTEFSFEHLIQRVVTINHFRINEKKQNLTAHIDKEIPKIIFGDEQRLAQVITNLLSNSVKFTPDNGFIHIDARLLEEKEEVCTIQISVTDSGIGISREQQEKLFQSFQQADSSTSKKFGGTGLGLTISKNIVEMMDGKIWIESELGKGATFSFTIQVNRVREMEYIVPDWRKVRFLAVDDDHDALEYFNEIMERSGAPCDTVSTGKNALKMIEQNGAYDFYFVDYRLPDMDGMELTRILKAGKTDGERCIVIMMSSIDWSVIEKEAKKAGVDGFLSKPLFSSPIVDIVNGYIGIEKKDVKTAHKNQENPIQQFNGRHVLLVDDVEINREIVQTLLEPTLINIDCAENGMQAVDMFRKAPDKYDMIFMDVQMPEMDGYDATRAIRILNVPNAKKIPIIAMTANVFREDIKKCLEAGMNDHVGKPVDFDEVLNKLRIYLT